MKTIKPLAYFVKVELTFHLMPWMISVIRCVNRTFNLAHRSKKLVYSMSGGWKSEWESFLFVYLRLSLLLALGQMLYLIINLQWRISEEWALIITYTKEQNVYFMWCKSECIFITEMYFCLTFAEMASMNHIHGARTKILSCITSQFGGRLKDSEILLFLFINLLIILLTEVVHIFV